MTWMWVALVVVAVLVAARVARTTSSGAGEPGAPAASRRSEGTQYEGWWEAEEGTTSPDLHGKIEWEPSMDGGTEIDLLVSKLAVPDGDEVEVVADGRTVMRAPVRGGKVRHIIKSSEGHAIPTLAHTAVELRHRGQVLARTVLEPD